MSTNRVKLLCEDVLGRLKSFYKPAAMSENTVDGPPIKGPVLAGSAISVLFLGCFFVWGSLAPVASASIANGVVSAEGKTRTVQHLEGGIIRHIIAGDGDKVMAGDVLLRFDDTKARAMFDLLAKRKMSTLAEMARLRAEQNGKDKIRFPFLLTESDDPNVYDIIEGQKVAFTSRRENLANQVSILEQRIAEYRAEITGLKGGLQSNEQQLRLTREQITDVRVLLEEGLARKPRLLELEVKASEIENRLLHSRSQITRNKQRIKGAEASISETLTKYASQVAEALKKTDAELLDMEERMRAAEDVLIRTEVLAPVDGIITNTRVFTKGGVISPGDELFDIVPDGERLIVETRVIPNDIDIVRPGLEARVRFTALNQRNAQPVPGTVSSISADHLVDPIDGTSYYLATVILDADALELEQSELYPGMQAEVMIQTGSRTALGYIFEPLTRSFDRAFREN